jgi:hypothetical protein
MDDYKIPRYGPKRNRFKVSDLEDWMMSPELFKADNDSESQENRNFRKVK